jgi:GDPmannose 4,6-dehydratase
MSKLAFITGITGQDGSYLSELLLEKDYKVFGIVRRTSLLYSHSRIDHIREKLNINYGDVSDACALHQFFNSILQNNQDFKVFEIYNLAAQSHVQISFEIPEYTTTIDALGPLHILEFIRSQPDNIKNKIKFYQAGTSEMYGKVLETPQSETTPFNPVSPYACAKVYAHFITKNYREAYNIFACNGILFNHESPRRGENFVTMKVINGIKDYLEKKKPINLGNIDSKRDWGHAKDYVKGMWLMLQRDAPDDYVLATGQTQTVREFVEKSFKYKGIKIYWLESIKNILDLVKLIYYWVTRLKQKTF